MTPAMIIQNAFTEEGRVGLVLESEGVVNKGTT